MMHNNNITVLQLNFTALQHKITTLNFLLKQLTRGLVVNGVTLFHYINSNVWRIPLAITGSSMCVSLVRTTAVTAQRY